MLMQYAWNYSPQSDISLPAMLRLVLRHGGDFADPWHGFPRYSKHPSYQFISIYYIYINIYQYQYIYIYIYISSIIIARYRAFSFPHQTPQTPLRLRPRRVANSTGRMKEMLYGLAAEKMRRWIRLANPSYQLEQWNTSEIGWDDIALITVMFVVATERCWHLLGKLGVNLQHLSTILEMSSVLVNPSVSCCLLALAGVWGTLWGTPLKRVPGLCCIACRLNSAASLACLVTCLHMQMHTDTRYV